MVESLKFNKSISVEFHDLSLLKKPHWQFVRSIDYALKFYSGEKLWKLKLIVRYLPKYLLGNKVISRLPFDIISWIDANNYVLESFYSGIEGDDQTCLIYCSCLSQKNGVYIKYAKHPTHVKKVINEEKASKKFWKFLNSPSLIRILNYETIGFWLVIDDAGKFNTLTKYQEVQILNILLKANKPLEYISITTILNTKNLLEVIYKSQLLKSLFSISNLETVKRTVLNMSKAIVGVCDSHGDFTPWNVGWNGQFLIFDFEKYSCNRPVGYDIIHYLMLKKLLSENKSPNRVLEETKENMLVLSILDIDKWSLHYWALYQLNSYLWSYEKIHNLHWQAKIQVELWIKILMIQPAED
jgi:hypothetical protein